MAKAVFEGITYTGKVIPIGKGYIQFEMSSGVDFILKEEDVIEND